jgi:c-di-GMP-binding flagellar brake protein YcgR
MTRERRAHARVAVPINVRVVVGAKEIELPVRDISKRGIFLYTKEPPAMVGAPLTLKLAMTAGIKPLTIHAKVVRIVMEADIGLTTTLGMALRFVDLDVAGEKSLMDLIDRAMLGNGTKMRAFPRVYHLLEIACKTRRQMRALVRDIGEGGMGMTVDDKISVNEEISLEILRPGEAPLRLTGWAVTAEPITDKPGHTRVGLRFARIPPNIRRDLQAYLKKLYRD